MATGINKVTLLGNLGSDPELRYLPNGNAVLNVSLFSDESYFNDQNQKVENGEWHRLSFFGRKAEVVAQHCKKGDQLYIEGRNHTNEWEKDGVKRYSTEVQVKEFRFCRNAGDHNSSTDTAQPGYAPQQAAPQQAPQAQTIYGHYYADGNAMPPHEVQRYKAFGYADGWQKGTVPPALPQA